MKEDLMATRWNRVAIRLNVPPSTGVFLLGANEDEDGPNEVLLVGSAPNLRRRMLELLDREEIKAMSARVIHWVAGLTAEQAQLAERLFVRRYNPPLNLHTATPYLDILIG